MEKTLPLSGSMSLPIDTITRKLAWFGGNGAGKSYGAMKLAESMWDAGAQFVAFDPVGIWYGLRIAGDGTPGLPIVVFGGLYGDIQIGPHDGKTIAEVIAGEGISAVVDVSQFETDGQKGLFASDFAERFFFLKKASKGAVHIFLEEAQEFVPENPAGGPTSKETLMANRFQRIWKIGRNYGIGGSLISQRPQEISKKALNLCECVLTFRLTGPHERDYMAKWLSGHGLKDIAAQLPSFKVGVPLVWSPAWLDFTGFVEIGQKRTFDVSATPEVGVIEKARVLAPVAVDALRARLAQPKEDDLQSATKNATKPADHSSISKQLELTETEKMRLVRTLDQVQAELATYKKFFDQMTYHVTGITQLSVDIGHELGILGDGEAYEERYVPPADPLAPLKGRQGEPVAVKAKPAAKPTQENEGASATLDGPSQRILNGLAELQALGIKDAPRQLTALMAGYSHVNSKGFTNALGSLRSAALLEYPGAGRVALTATGIKCSEAKEVPRDLADLQQRALSLLDGTAQRVLRPLIAAYPSSMARADLAMAAGYGHLNSKGFTNAIGKLRGLGMLDYPASGQVAATDVLFPEGLK